MATSPDLAGLFSLERGRGPGTARGSGNSAQAACRSSMRSARASTGLEGVARCALAGVKNGGRYKVNEPTAGDWEQTGAPLDLKVWRAAVAAHLWPARPRRTSHRASTGTTGDAGPLQGNARQGK